MPASDQIVLTERAERRNRDSAFTVAGRWYSARRAPQRGAQSCSRQPTRSPIVMAAVDLSGGMEPLAEALRVAVRRVLETERGARLACVNVLKLSRIALEEFEDEEGRNLHLQRLAELRLWAHFLALSPNGTTYHLLESPDPAVAILEYAVTNQVDLIIVGARASCSRGASSAVCPRAWSRRRPAR